MADTIGAIGARRVRLVRRILAGVCVGFVIMGAIFVTTLAAEQRARLQSERTAEVLSLVRGALRAGLDAETGQRGFLLTYDAAYLGPFQEARSEWPQLIVRIKEVLGDRASATQLALIDEMSALAQAKLTELQETVDLAQAGDKAAALRIVTSDLGRDLMVDFRDTAARLEGLEVELLRASKLRAERVELWSVALIAVIALGVAAVLAVTFWLEHRARYAEYTAWELERARLERERADTLAQELSHRVKNLFAVIAAMISLSARDETDVRRMASSLRSRIQTLAQAHDVALQHTGRIDLPLSEIVSRILAPYDRDGVEIDIQGPQVPIPSQSVTPLALLLHELATNALKYGAFSGPGGRLAVSWVAGADGAIDLDWRESGQQKAPEEDEGQGNGFGTRLLQLTAQQLNGALTSATTPDGQLIQLELKLPAA